MGIFVFADRSLSRCWGADGFIMLVFRYSVAVSISVFVFSEIEVEVERLKISLKSCQLVSWLWIRQLGGFSIIAVEPTVAITGKWSEESSVEELIWTYLGEIFLVMKKSSKSGILLVSGRQYVSSYVVRKLRLLVLMLFRRFLPLAVASLLPHWICLAL